jgi:hypothetical protein
VRNHPHFSSLTPRRLAPNSRRRNNPVRSTTCPRLGRLSQERVFAGYASLLRPCPRGGARPATTGPDPKDRDAPPALRASRAPNRPLDQSRAPLRARTPSDRPRPPHATITRPPAQSAAYGSRAHRAIDDDEQSPRRPARPAFSLPLHVFNPAPSALLCPTEISPILPSKELSKLPCDLFRSRTAFVTPQPAYIVARVYCYYRLSFSADAFRRVLHSFYLLPLPLSFSLSAALLLPCPSGTTYRPTRAVHDLVPVARRLAPGPSR